MLGDTIRRTTAAAAIAAALCAPLAARAETTLKVGTLAPAESPWGKVFKVWGRAVSDRTSGAVSLAFYWNGQQGEEDDMVGKIRTGQLDGAALTAIGLGQIYKNTLVLQLPGMFQSWAKLDQARAALKPTFDAEFDKAGFKILGWGDVGVGCFLSSGYDVRTPGDLRHKGVFILPGDPIDPMIYTQVGEMTPKQMAVTEVLGALASGVVTAINVPPLVAEQLQWASRLDHVNPYPTHYEIGALVMSSSKFKALPADAQNVILETGKIAGEALTATVRKEDDAALVRRKAKMTTFEPGPAERGAWAKLFADVRAKLKGGTFSAQVYDEAAKYSN